jgi:hypothetical protein
MDFLRGADRPSAPAPAHVEDTGRIDTVLL